MSEKYVTKMGWEIERRTTGETYLRANGENRLSGWDFLSVSDMLNLREYFLAERDKETPYSVVEGEYTIARFFERELAEKFVEKMGHEFMRILPEEPKPWRDAEPGEVWILTTTGVDSRYETTAFTVEYEPERDYTKFVPVEPDYSVSHLGVNATLITEGHRVWPEREDDNNE